MKTCNNCFWADRCPDASKRCEYYDPIVGSENVVFREYNSDLRAREKDYQEIVEEQENI